jgi:hypothetical protein
VFWIGSDWSGLIWLVIGATEHDWPRVATRIGGGDLRRVLWICSREVVSYDFAGLTFYMNWIVSVKSPEGNIVC